MGSAQSANWAISSWSWQLWGSRLRTFTQTPGLLDTSVREKKREKNDQKKKAGIIYAGGKKKSIQALEKKGQE